MSNLFNRYVWLVDTVYRKGKLTFTEISALWSRSALNKTGEEFPLRTFHAHRAAVRAIFGITVGCDRRGESAYFIETGEEGGAEKDGLRAWLFSSLAACSLVNESSGLGGRVLFESVASGLQRLMPIIEAMRDGLRVEAAYGVISSEGPASFEIDEIEPYCVREFRQRWYVAARSVYHGGVRVYPLCLVQSLRITGTPFSMPEDFCPEAFFRNAFGAATDETAAPCAVRLRASGAARKYLRAEPLHHSQKEAETAGNCSVFSYYLSPSLDFMRELLSYGDEIEVLSPGWLRDEMKKTARSMYSLYRQPL